MISLSQQQTRYSFCSRDKLTLFINKTIIRASSDSWRIDARADAGIRINFGCPKRGSAAVVNCFAVSCSHDIVRIPFPPASVGADGVLKPDTVNRQLTPAENHDKLIRFVALVGPLKVIQPELDSPNTSRSYIFVLVGK